MFLSLLEILLLVALGIAVVLFLAKVVEIIILVISRIIRFFLHTVRDVFRLFGHAASGVMLLPLTLVNMLLLNRQRLGHYLQAIVAEVRGVLISIWRLGLGNLFNIFDADPSQPKTKTQVVSFAKSNQSNSGFDGYKIIGSLPGGGSGAKLYIAEPSFEKLLQLQEAGFPPIQKVVLKSFALTGGPSLPQIMRESKSLEAAKRLGFVLEHGTDERHFWYAMPYVPGDNLSLVCKKMHQDFGDHGLRDDALVQGLSYVSDLLLALEKFHQGGLWHKDVKPENVVVCGQRAYLVDLGLVTSLASSATLTTHGTEYFRDPELVRLAMQGVKVNEVDGVKFDLYGAGAVLYSVLEGNFPAHGGLSRITKKCPDALQWIVRRSMAEISGRYENARAMLMDLHKVIEADDPFSLKPADLPSMGGSAPTQISEKVSKLKEYRPLKHEGGSSSIDSHGGSVIAIEVLAGAQAGKLFPLRPGRHTIGRSSHCDLTLEGSAISNRHLRIDVGPEGEVKFKDLGSRNGVWVGAVRKESGIWSHGNEISLGRLGLRLHVGVQTTDTDLVVELDLASSKRFKAIAAIVLLWIFSDVAFDFNPISSIEHIATEVKREFSNKTDYPSMPNLLPWGDVIIQRNKDLHLNHNSSIGDSLLVIDEVGGFGTPNIRERVGEAKAHVSKEFALLGDWGGQEYAYEELVAQLRATVGAGEPSVHEDELVDLIAAAGDFSGLLWIRRADEDEQLDAFLLCLDNEDEDHLLSQLRLN